MLSRFVILAASFLIPAVALALPKTLPVPVSPLGTIAAVDLPADQHMRNTRGRDGLGLCVWTSLEMSGRAQDVVALNGLQNWMKSQPGGGYPQKVDSLLPRFAKGVNYVQHTGGDEAFLDLVIRTGRLVCITYGGNDDFYRGYVAHMVNGCHIDGKEACIIDNNRPGKWVWMTREELLTRWRAGGGGGWAVVFLDSPLPPTPNEDLPPNPTFTSTDPLPACDCNGGETCKCLLGTCRCYPDDPDDALFKIEQCGPNGCGVPAVPTYTRTQWPNGVEAVFLDGRFVGAVVDGDFREATGPYTYDSVASRAPWEPEPPTGVETDHMNPGRTHRYYHNGKEVTKAQAYSAIGEATLTDDSDKYFVTGVGSDFEARLRSDPALAPYLGRLHIHGLAADHWFVKERMNGNVVRFQKPKKEGAGVLYESSVLDYVKIVQVILNTFNPPKPAPPSPTPTPTPPTPAPGFSFTPAHGLTLGLLGVAGALIFRRKKGN